MLFSQPRPCLSNRHSETRHDAKRERGHVCPKKTRVCAVYTCKVVQSNLLALYHRFDKNHIEIDLPRHKKGELRKLVHVKLGLRKKKKKKFLSAKFALKDNKRDDARLRGVQKRFFGGKKKTLRLFFPTGSYT